MTEPKRPSARVAALPPAVSLQTVRLIRCQSEFLGIQKGDVLEQLKLDLRAGGRKSPNAPNVLQAFVGIDCSVRPRDHERVVAKVSCDLALDYLVSNATLFAELTEKDCDEFASLNGLYNAWPYLREYCQSVSLRMLLPAPIMLPSLALSMKNAKPATEQS
jgi:hypothetical protein